MKSEWTASDKHEEMRNLIGVCHIDSVVCAPGVLITPSIDDLGSP